jgi:hypothetical protein
LEKLGFPWILSSESRLISGLRGFFLKFFSSRFWRREAPSTRLAHDLAKANGQIAHRASLAQFLIFCKKSPSEIAIGAVPFQPAPSKGDSP